MQLSKQEILQCTRETLAMLKKTGTGLLNLPVQMIYVYAACDEQNYFSNFTLYFFFLFFFCTLFLFLFFFFYSSLQLSSQPVIAQYELHGQKVDTSTKPSEQPEERILVSMGRLLTPLVEWLWLRLRETCRKTEIGRAHV